MSPLFTTIGPDEQGSTTKETFSETYASPYDVTAGEVHEIDPAMAKRIVRKIDKRILICCLITYTLNFIDKTLLGYSAIFGIIQSTHLVGDQYSWVSSIFYFGYLLWEYPTTILIQKLPIGKYLSCTVILWGALVAASAASNNFGAVAATRFLLGVLEATVVPSFVYIISQWYTRDETPARTGFWFVGTDVGSIIAALIIYGLGHSHGIIDTWRIMFIIFGCLTFVWGIAMYFILPDTIESCTFLTEDEKSFAQSRVRLHGTGNLDPLVNGTVNWAQVREALMDPKTWFFFASYFLTQISNGGLQNFGNLVVDGFGFSSLDTVLFGIPASFIAGVTIWGSGIIAGRFKNITTYLIAAVLVPPVIGGAIIYTQNGRGVRLFGYYLLQTAYASNPLALSLVATNFKGATKKMTVTAVLFIGYCAGNISGPHFFITKEAPRYATGFRAVFSTFALAIVITLLLRTYLVWKNLKSAQEPANADSIDVNQLVEEDITDWEAKGFIYRL
ncbi:hypothetical protein BP6252_14074 [Coleophoma cylindrospora]|uniref:Major facilitator superfamily (MFS) profile domain-containing protein n=1 Tax=Coleophoma cylindrospora TaxID=1849047 RepID=A0A3D8Q495_9HELO|nr:hypothetical protein BP6252_14074 [Coleophoma cylindrospora]